MTEKKSLDILLSIVFIGISIYFVYKTIFLINYLLEKPTPVSTVSREITGIKASSDINEQAVLYRSLIERVGPGQAQEELFRSGLPFTGQTHLLNHTVGDYLYEKFGPAGLAQCKDYFLSSCYHGVVLRAIGDKGLPAILQIMNSCKEQSVGLDQCAHAVGHGLLVWSGYQNLTGALALCDREGSKFKGFSFGSCYDGIFMENIWAVHEGTPSPKRWVKEEDLFYPCTDRRITKKYLDACYANQPALVFQLVKGDFKKVGDFCDSVKDFNLKRTCFDGLARQIHPYTNGNIDKTFELCANVPSSWATFCQEAVAKAFASVGDVEGAKKLCGKVVGPKDFCSK